MAVRALVARAVLVARAAQVARVVARARRVPQALPERVAPAGLALSTLALTQRTRAELE